MIQSEKDRDAPGEPRLNNGGEDSSGSPRVVRIFRATGAWFYRRMEYWIIFLLAFGAFANSLGNDYAFDDTFIAKNNYRIRRLDRPREILLTSYWDSPDRGLEYRPLTMLSYALNYAAAQRIMGHAWFSGVWPEDLDFLAFSHHFTNVALHGLVSCLVAMVVTGLFRRRLLGAATGILFALHPVHTEAVASVVGRAELLGAAGFFVTLIAWRRAREAPSAGRSAKWALPAAVALLLGAFCKENALTLTGVVFLEAFVWRRAEKLAGREPPGWRVLLVRHGACLVGFACAVILVLAARKVVLGSMGRPEMAAVGFMDNTIYNAPAFKRVATAIGIQGDYLWLLVWPVRLIADFSYDSVPTAHSLLDSGVLGGLIALAGLCAVFLIALFKAPVMAFAIGFYFLTMSLTSNILFPIGTIKAERLLYLPSFGYCLLLGWGFERIWSLFSNRISRTFVCILFAGVCAAYTVRAVARNPVWHDDIRLFTSVIRELPNNAKAHHNLGSAYMSLEQDFEKADLHFDRALEIQRVNPMPLITKAAIRMAECKRFRAAGDFDQAEREWQLAEGYLCEAVDSRPTYHAGRLQYGTLLCMKGRFSEGLSELEEAHRINRKDYMTLRAAGWWHFYGAGQGDTKIERLEKAVYYLTQCLDMEPNDYQSLAALGISLFELGRYKESLAPLDAALRTKSEKKSEEGLGDLRLFIGASLYFEGRLDEAQKAFEEVLSIDPENKKAIEGIKKIKETRETGVIESGLVK
jgi:tetratricopeptide (TPR) repeat protein